MSARLFLTVVLGVAANAGAATVFTQNFDNIVTLAGDGFVQINNSSPVGLTNWFQGNDTVFVAHSGATTSYIGANFNNTTGANTISNWLLTPEVTVANGDTLLFYTRTVDSPIFPDRLEVRFSGNGASTSVGATAADVGDFTNLLHSVNPGLTVNGYPNTWTLQTVTVTGLVGSVSGRFGLRYFVTNGGPSGANSDYIGIDTLSFESNANVVPEPATALLMGAGLAFAVLKARRRRS